MNSSPYKEPVTGSRQSPNNFLNIQRNYPFSKDTSPPNGDAQGSQDLSKKESSKNNADSFLDQKATTIKRSPKGSSSPNDESTGNTESIPSAGRLTPTVDEKIDIKPQENSSSSRSGSPEEERTEIEEDRSSHDGSVASLDGFKDGKDINSY